MDSQPEDIAALRAELALARAQLADDAATIARQNLEIAKLKRQIYGPRSERTGRLLDQMELELEELEAGATEDEIAAEQAAAKSTNVAPFTRKRFTFRPRAGTCLLWPAFLKHWVHPNRSDEERVSAAFNSWFVRKA